MSGIENLGLHCFTNATFQCLAHVPGVVHTLQQHRSVHEQEGKNKNYCCIKILIT